MKNCLINLSFVWTIKKNIYIILICYFLNNLLDAVANHRKSSSSLYFISSAPVINSTLIQGGYKTPSPLCFSTIYILSDFQL